MGRKKIPSMLVKKVWQEAASCCAFCNATQVETLELHHIDEDATNNILENLLLVCSSCHSKITHGVISYADVLTQKRIIQFQAKGNNVNDATPLQNVSVVNSPNSGIIANVVNLKGKRMPKMSYPMDSIGADLLKKNYVDHLYGRYVECRKSDSHFGAYDHAKKFFPGELHTTIRSKFEARTFFIHVNRFNELVDYMKSRIDNTILGRNNRSKGIPNYRDFDEFCDGQTGK